MVTPAFSQLYRRCGPSTCARSAAATAGMIIEFCRQKGPSQWGLRPATAFSVSRSKSRPGEKVNDLDNPGLRNAWHLPIQHGWLQATRIWTSIMLLILCGQRAGFLCAAVVIPTG